MWARQMVISCVHGKVKPPLMGRGEVGPLRWAVNRKVGGFKPFPALPLRSPAAEASLNLAVSGGGLHCASATPGNEA